MTDQAQAGRARRYQEILEKHPEWTPAILADAPIAQLVAVFGAKEDSFGSWAEALPSINRGRAEKGLPPLKLVDRKLVPATE